MENGESDLIRRAVNGEAVAFDRLVDLHTGRLYRLVRRAASDPAEAEAFVQEAWLRAWKNRQRCSPDRPFFPWLAAIAMNLARDSWRKRRPMDFADVADSVELVAAEEASIELQVEASQARARLSRYVEELRPEWRMAIALRYDGGLEYTEIAEVLGVPLNTVRTHLRRAKGALRARWEEDDAGSIG
jgi:RNA polymerase sigma-70 factor (ECF subfamily)